MSQNQQDSEPLSVRLMVQTTSYCTVHITASRNNWLFLCLFLNYLIALILSVYKNDLQKHQELTNTSQQHRATKPKAQQYFYRFLWTESFTTELHVASSRLFICLCQPHQLVPTLCQLMPAPNLHPPIHLWIPSGFLNPVDRWCLGARRGQEWSEVRASSASLLMDYTSLKTVH